MEEEGKEKVESGRDRESAREQVRSRPLPSILAHPRNHFFFINKKQVVEILKNRFLLACVHDEAAFAGSKLARESLTYSIDRELVSDEFFDFTVFRPRLFFFFFSFLLSLLPRSLPPLTPPLFLPPLPLSLSQTTPLGL